MASSTKASAASEQSSVQPSATLIEALHHKLCDPSIVPEFERCRSPHVTQRLITPRWILKDSAAAKVAGADSKAVGGSSINKNESTQKSDTNNHDNGKETNNNNEPKFNTRPKRNYLDIRKQQNTTFANEQYIRCQKKLAALSSTSPKSVEAINVNKLQIKKVIDSIQNHLNEGLAACPNHEGLVQVECEVRGWLDRLNGVVVVNGFNGLASAVVDRATVAMAGAEDRRGNNNTIIDLTQTNTQQTVVVKRKGGEGRAQAAMDDALVEKMFLQGETDTAGDSKNNDDAVDANQLKWVPPASRVDESADQHMRRKEGASDSDSYHGRRRSRHSHRRRSSRYQSKSRSRSRSAEREDRRKGERRHRHRRRDDDRKRQKRRHRSRSRSMSRGSISSAAASLASRSTSRDRSSKRRHRRDRHRHKRTYKSKSRRKERKKSSRRHRSRRERSQSVSSSCPSTAGADGIKGRFEPPQLDQQVQKDTEEGRPVQREDMDGLEPQSNDSGALGETIQSGD
eukprot:scaffold1208_cov145-Skeletonema_marinoi.AAC.5